MQYFSLYHDYMLLDLENILHCFQFYESMKCIFVIDIHVFR